MSWIKWAWERLLDVHAFTVAQIGFHPGVAFWVIVILAVVAAL